MSVITGGAALWDFFEAWRLAHTAQSEPAFAARFGESSVLLALHGTDLAAVYLRALSPAEPPQAANSQLDIHIIDGAACALPLPRLGWEVEDFGLKRRVPGWSDDSITTYLLLGEQGVSVVDWTRKRVFVWVPDHLSVPWWEQATPLRWLFDELADRTGLSTLHAAVVGRRGTGVVIAGPGGSGKSTLALECVRAGMDYVADDYCLLDTRAGMVCRNLYTTAKMEPKAAREDSRGAGKNTEPKDILFLRESHRAQLVSELRIGAILLPRFGDELRLEEVSLMEALRNIAPSTVAQSEAAGARLLKNIGELVRAVPAYRFHMPPNPPACAAAVSDVLDRLLAPKRTEPA